MVAQVVGQGAALVAAGIAVGAVGAAALTRLLSSLLFGVSAIDPVAFAAAAAALLAVGLLAALVPAWRAGTRRPGPGAARAVARPAQSMWCLAR